jgi:hypothetical protein
MEAVELQKLNVSFFTVINNLEMEYSYYFCLQSIQKGLDHIESIYDHFKLNLDTLEVDFSVNSDLPAAIKDIIRNTHQQIFFGEGAILTDLH